MVDATVQTHSVGLTARLGGGGPTTVWGTGSMRGRLTIRCETWERGSEWLPLTYLADGPCRWAHIVTLVIDAAGHGVDTNGATLAPWQT